MVIVCQHSWCPFLGWHGGDACGTGWTTPCRRIYRQWCWLHLGFAGLAHFPILAEVVTRVFIGGVFVFLNLLLYLFLCWHRGFFGDHLNVLRVTLLLNDCSASSRTGLDTQHVWTLLFCLSGPNNLLCCDCNCYGICSIWSLSNPGLGGRGRGSFIGTSVLKASSRIVVQLVVRGV